MHGKGQSKPCGIMALGSFCLLLGAFPAIQPLFGQSGTCYKTSLIILGTETLHLSFQDSSFQWIAFNACPGRTYTLDTRNLGALADTVLEVFDTDCGPMLASDDNSGGGNASRIVWTAPGSGTYHLKVRQADGSTGSGRTFDLNLSGNTSPCSLWMKSYGKTTQDPLVDIALAPDGGIILAGNTYPTGSPVYDVWMLKTDPLGQVQWQNKFATAGNDFAASVFSTPDGGSILGMSSDPFSASEYEVRLVKSNALGTTTWRGTLPAITREPHVNKIVLASDGGYILAGSYYDMQAPPFYYPFITKLNASWQILWLKMINTGDFYWPDTLAELADGSVLVTRNQSTNVWTAKLTPTGDFAWQETLVGSGSDFVSGLLPLSDGGVLLAGTTTSWGAGGWDAWIMKLNGSGQVLWEKTYGTTASEGFSTVTLCHDGTLAAVGGLGANLWMAKLSSGGPLYWGRTFGPGYGRRIVESPDGGYYIATDSTSYGAGSLDALVLKTDGAGGITGGCTQTDTTTATGNSSVSVVTGGNPFTNSGLNSSSGASTWGAAWDAVQGDICGIALPREVSPPSSPQHLLFTDPTHLVWEDGAASDSTSFNLYRGTLADLLPGGSLNCLQSNISVNFTFEDETPPADVCWVYLVTGRNAIGEGPMGSDSSNLPHPNSVPCP